MSKKVIVGSIMLVCLISILSCLLPFLYFMIFPANNETQRKAMELPKGVVAEFCFNYWKNDIHPYNIDFRWSEPGTFGVEMPAITDFNRCGYMPWLPFISLPNANTGIGYFNFPSP